MRCKRHYLLGAASLAALLMCSTGEAMAQCSRGGRGSTPTGSNSTFNPALPYSSSSLVSNSPSAYPSSVALIGQQYQQQAQSIGYQNSQQQRLSTLARDEQARPYRLARAEAKRAERAERIAARLAERDGSSSGNRYELTSARVDL
ncbi:hypothetical protein [Rubripirellula reticaptiva]|uniref:Outer membrane efflux protein n=1 Tax=Rubripirellula reticaptiva TaxID=2528013 RepID=A0A5C6EL75_9BACT|nr:hypothetical protein [Rubripirellula reticaptiva]TWU48356.1 hypothetical protein Poly59_52020 [Rubripirellula reticaptiva]